MFLSNSKFPNCNIDIDSPLVTRTCNTAYVRSRTVQDPRRQTVFSQNIQESSKILHEKAVQVSIQVLDYPNTEITLYHVSMKFKAESPSYAGNMNGAGNMTMENFF
jgi:hypothetical protein